MNAKILYTALMAALMSFTSVRADDSWEKYTPTGDKYSARFPAQPREETMTQKTPFGSMRVQMAMSLDEDTGTIYMTGTCKLPKAAVALASKNPDALLDGFSQGATGVGDGKIVKTSKIKMGPHPGREFEATVADGTAHVHGRVYIVDGQLYMIAVISSKGEQDARAAAKFFKSFEVSKLSNNDD